MPKRPDRRPLARGDRPDLHRARRVRRQAVPRRPASKRFIGRRRTAAPPTSTGPLHNEIPAPNRDDRQQHPVAGRLQPGALRGHVLQPDGGVLRDPVLGPLHHRRRRDRVGQGALQRGALRSQLLRQHRLRHQQGAGARRAGHVGRQQAAPDRRSSHDAAADPRLPDDLRRRGPLRHRRRRRLQRARRRHRPLPDRARRRRRGRWRPEPGHRRHLEPPVRAPTCSRRPARRRRQRRHQRRHSSSSALVPEQPDRHVGLRLHRAARERRSGRLRPRVRPRPRPAGPLRHLRQHRRRREQHGVLDPDVLRRQHRRRRPRRHRRRPDRHGRLGAADARLARRRRATRARSTRGAVRRDARRGPRPEHPGHQEAVRRW